MTDSIPSHPPLVKRTKLPRNLKAFVWFFTQGQCWYCGSLPNPFENFCIDHVIPLARGGADEIENLVPCCLQCNVKKGVQLIDEWRSNFARADLLDEEPWSDPSGLFWFERDAFFVRHRQSEIATYRRFYADSGQRGDA